MRKVETVVLVVSVLIAGSAVRAAEPLPAGRAIQDVIDHYVDARLKEAGIPAAPLADDSNLIRRLTLDLVGRIPTVAETEAYLAASNPGKRAEVVDRLMASPGYIRHQATEFDVMMMAGSRGSVRDYLMRAFAENRSWDRMFRDVLLANENDPAQKGAAEFIKQRVKDLDKLTSEVSIVFFGVNISCAKCHDHPRVPDWKQDHFYGMKSFFNRTFDNGGFVAEREYGLVKYKTTSGEERQAKLMFLTGKAVDGASLKEPSNEEQKQEKERLEAAKKNKTPPPLPKFSARAQLVEIALQPGQRDFFSRAIVNRLWLRLFGHGLVMPVDQMHSENPPSHPELLRWLARDLEKHQYDLRRLIRGLVLSQAYARSSRWEGDNPPASNLFAMANVRPLTPMQLATSLRLATTDPASLARDVERADFEKRLEGIEASARGLAALLDQPGENFQVGVSEALLFSNNERIMKDYLADDGDRLAARLKQTKDPVELIGTAVRAVLSRPATKDEIKLLEAYLNQRGDRTVDACQQLVWALITSPEFRFNY
jgi:hypothetical protein